MFTKKTRVFQSIITAFLNMKINLTATQWRDIQICLLKAISNSAKDGKKPDLDCVINKRYLQTHDLIEMNLPVKL